MRTMLLYISLDLSISNFNLCHLLILFTQSFILSSILDILFQPITFSSNSYGATRPTLFLLTPLGTTSSSRFISWIISNNLEHNCFVSALSWSSLAHTILFTRVSMSVSVGRYLGSRTLVLVTLSWDVNLPSLCRWEEQTDLLLDDDDNDAPSSSPSSSPHQHCKSRLAVVVEEVLFFHDMIVKSKNSLL